MSEEKEAEYGRFVSTTIRPGKRGIFQENLAHHLSLAVSASPLKKVRLACEASLMLDQKQLEKLEIDREAVETIHQVCMCLTNAVKAPKGLTVVRWGFPATNRNYRKYVKPWLGNTDFDFLFRYEEESEFGGDCIKTDLPDWILELTRKEKLTDKDASDLFFWASSSRLTAYGFTDLSNQFVEWALPQTQALCRKLSTLVTPDVYRDILTMMKGERERESNMDQRKR